MAASICTPVFKFSHDGYSVKVDNIAAGVSQQEIVDLFSSLIGEVSKYTRFLGDGNRRSLELTFSSQDAAKKALCMTGYNVAGIPLSVSPSQPPESHRVHKRGGANDTRRNLYVLGLPFDLTKSEFAEIFSRFGEVSHAVILATVDNASRRRGFVVMSSHHEAKAAMAGLSRKEIKGHVIDVSWAVVQRSQGFLDGGDRTVALSPHSPSSSPVPTPFDVEPFSPLVSCSPSPTIATPDLGTQTPPIVTTSDQLGAGSALLVTNLPAALFSSDSDLRPLFCPYGDVKDIKRLSSGPTDHNISVVVEYESSDQAREARDMLQGQVYANQPLSVDFLNPPAPRPALDQWNATIADVKARLNPNAAPFSMNTAFNDYVPRRSPFNQDQGFSPYEHSVCSNNVPSGLVGNPYQSAAPIMPRPIMYNSLSPPATNQVRPNSAPSRWTEQPRLPRSAPWACSSQDLTSLASASMLSTYST
ncbi:hypothetical protein EIP91_005349 [Steccherinum ochraceum]|uniref:RRM domain-containing protein n=1 Tax=Steccherinum ochraceum TaxID=92696 RepID=A0A4R0R7A1_9APHY|nr:hypothetical protein EIP91_005349 [Steccherinum ochraceum]